MPKDLKELYLEITKDRGKPLDFWEVAALLEIYGIRDVDAQKEYGFKDVFDMAKYLYEHYKDIVSYPQKHLISEMKPPPYKKRVVKNFIKGIAFAMPMFLQIFFTIVFGYALWSNISLDITDATVIAIGTFLALIVSGGFAQIIGRKGLYYLKLKEYILSAKIMKILLALGFVSTILLAVLFIMLNLVFSIFDEYLLYLFISTFVLLSFLFLISSVYYVFEEYEKIFYFFFLGIVFVFIFHYLFGIEFPRAQFMGIALLDAVFLIFAFRKLHYLRTIQESEGEILPRASMLFFTLVNFFIYGLLYFIFLVSDKVIAWNANSVSRGFFLWFDVKYEIGTDIGLLILVILMGLVEVIVYEFLYNLNSSVFKYRFDRYKDFNRYLEKFYNRSSRLFFIFSVASIIVIYIIVMIVKDKVDIQKLPFIDYSALVFFVSSIAYALLAFALLNTLVLFSFSRQGVVIKAIFFATISNIIIGIILANTVAHYLSVFGLLAGSMIFCCMTFNYMKKLLKDLDYYYYSAY